MAGGLAVSKPGAAAAPAAPGHGCPISTLDGVVGLGTTWVVADTETAPQTGYAPVTGLQMYYELHGSGGIPLLLLHGGLFNIDLQFGQLIPAWRRLARSSRPTSRATDGPVTSTDR